MAPKPDGLAAEPLIDHTDVEASEPKPLAWEPPGGLNRRNVRRGVSRRPRRPR